jgi:hypothetical protein
VVLALRFYALRAADVFIRWSEDAETEQPAALNIAFLSLKKGRREPLDNYHDDCKYHGESELNSELLARHRILLSEEVAGIDCEPDNPFTSRSG